MQKWILSSGGDSNASNLCTKLLSLVKIPFLLAVQNIAESRRI